MRVNEEGGGLYSIKPQDTAIGNGSFVFTAESHNATQWQGNRVYRDSGYPNRSDYSGGQWLLTDHAAPRHSKHTNTTTDTPHVQRTRPPITNLSTDSLSPLSPHSPSCLSPPLLLAPWPLPFLPLSNRGQRSRVRLTINVEHHLPLCGTHTLMEAKPHLTAPTQGVALSVRWGEKGAPHWCVPIGQGRTHSGSSSITSCSTPFSSLLPPFSPLLLPSSPPPLLSSPLSPFPSPPLPSLTSLKAGVS